MVLCAAIVSVYTADLFLVRLQTDHTRLQAIENHNMSTEESCRCMYSLKERHQIPMPTWPVS